MITSQITMRPITGSNPAAFTPIVPLNNGYEQFVGQMPIALKVPYGAFTFVSGDIPQTQLNFLAAVKTELDTNYLPTVFSDATKDYEVEITVTNVRLDFTTQVPDRGIWTERQYFYFTSVSLRTNVI